MANNTQIQISNDYKSIILIFTLALLLTVGLLSWLVATVSELKSVFRDTKTEVRILQMHMQDQNAILIRSGLLRPGDLTTGPTDPDKLGER